jgi:hypothetical protein
MTTDYDTEQLNLNIDLSNAITAANNAEIRGYTSSRSTGAAGIVSGVLGGLSSGLALDSAGDNAGLWKKGL